jgi:hypothetical protein
LLAFGSKVGYFEMIECSMRIQKKFAWESLSKIAKLEILSFLIYFLGLFPGKVGSDADKAMELMRNGESTANWTEVYFWFLKLLTFNGSYLALASGFGYACFLFSVHYLVRSIWKSANSFSAVTYSVVIFSPLIGVYGMTLDHNLQSTTGCLILTALVLQLLRKEELTSKTKILFFFALLLTSMSIIGIVTLAGFVLVLLITRQPLKLIASTGILATAIVLVGSSLPVTPRAVGFKYITALEDIRCLVSNENVKISESDLKILERFGPLSIWRDPVSCVIPDTGEFVRLKITPENENLIRGVWLRLFRDNPRYILVAHLQRSSVALPPGISGPQPNGYETDILLPLGANTPRWLHLWPGVIDDARFNAGDIQSQPQILKYLQYLIIFPSIVLNYNSHIWGWGGLWLLISGVILVRNWGRKGLIILVPVVTAHLFLFLMIPTPDPRYTYFSITLGLLLSGVRRKKLEHRDW